ncbi:hypothetical protein NQ317_004816 [Molorchus minor]|uniref:Cyclic nucleotide-binding domain-containing protein n=1 Tax=Molorchus minor TaxID=1323400 RepID=A0ABQ9JC65_9CUCU|nr:hypothetical protein NQ317_004816 [Molorchus minor]
MTKVNHHCHLPLETTHGFPKLPPNASTFRRLTRAFRNLLTVDLNNTKCKKFFPHRSAQVAEQKRYAKNCVFIVHPFSKFNSIMEVIFVTSWLLSCFIYPVANYGISDVDVNTLVYVHGYVNTYLQLPTMIYFFFVGYVDKKKKQVIIKPINVVWHYLRTYFVFDFVVTVMPLHFGIEFAIFKYCFNNNLYQSATALIIFHIFCYYVRIPVVSKGLDNMLTLFKIPKMMRYIIMKIIGTYLILHLINCLLFQIPEVIYLDYDEWPEESWLRQANIHFGSNSKLATVYLEGMTVTLCTFFGIAHQYEVTLTNEQFCLTLVMIFGRLYTLFLLADLLRAFGIARVSESSYEQQISRLNAYMTSKGLPWPLRKKLLKHYEDKFRKHCFNESEIDSTLSERLRTEIFLFSARKLIRGIPILTTLPKSTLGIVIAEMKLYTFSPKEIILRIGTVSDNIYFISSGTVAVYNEAGHELCHLKDSDEFGVVSTATEGIQRYGLEAIETTEIYYINLKLFAYLLEHHTNVLSYLNQRIKQRLDELQNIERTILKGGTDFLSDLRKGKVLESLRRKPQVSK